MLLDLKKMIPPPCFRWRICSISHLQWLNAGLGVVPGLFGGFQWWRMLAMSNLTGSTSMVPALDLAFMHLIHMVRDIHHYPPTFFVTELPLLRKQLPLMSASIDDMLHRNFDGQLQSFMVRFIHLLCFNCIIISQLILIP